VDQLIASVATLAEVFEAAAAGVLVVPIQRTYCRMVGKIVLIP
jgi:hypothetical protein